MTGATFTGSVNVSTSAPPSRTAETSSGRVRSSYTRVKTLPLEASERCSPSEPRTAPAPRSMTGTASSATTDWRVGSSSIISSVLSSEPVTKLDEESDIFAFASVSLYISNFARSTRDGGVASTASLKKSRTRPVPRSSDDSRSTGEVSSFSIAMSFMAPTSLPAWSSKAPADTSNLGYGACSNSRANSVFCESESDMRIFVSSAAVSSSAPESWPSALAPATEFTDRPARSKLPDDTRTSSLNVISSIPLSGLSAAFSMAGRTVSGTLLSRRICMPWSANEPDAEYARAPETNVSIPRESSR